MRDPIVIADAPGAITLAYSPWAHREGVVDLQANGVTLEHDDALQRQLVVETISRWGVAYDEARFDVIGSLFTADGRLDVLVGSSVPATSVKGRDAIVRSAQASIMQQGDQRRHFVTNVVVDRLTLTEATLLAFALVVVVGEPTQIAATVIYRVDLRREDDAVWRFSHFVIGLDSYAGALPRIDANGVSEPA